MSQSSYSEGIILNAATLADGASGSRAIILPPGMNQASLLVNLKAAPATSIAWTITEVDPVDQTTQVGATATHTSSTLAAAKLTIDVVGRCVLVTWASTGISTKVNASCYGSVVPAA
jgi:hypothetical protein